MNFYNHYQMDIEGTYIISIEGNEVSQKLTQQCIASCKEVNQHNIQVFPAFDATDSPIKTQNYNLGLPVGELGTIKVPEFLKDQAFINFLQVGRDLIY